MKRSAFVVGLLSVMVVGVMAAPASNAAAKQLFERYIALGHVYDVSIADLYADDAVIKNKRTYPTGEVRELTMPAANYKTLIRQAMRTAGYTKITQDTIYDKMMATA